MLYRKEAGGDRWLKIFVIPYDEAKELVYCNKKPGLRGYGAGYASVDSAWGAQWNETTTIEVAEEPSLAISDMPSPSGGSQPVGHAAEVHIASGAVETVGYGVYGASDTTEESDEAPNTDGVQLFGDAPGETLSSGTDHGSLQGLADADSSQYHIIGEDGTLEAVYQPNQPNTVEDAENHDDGEAEEDNQLPDGTEESEEHRAHGSSHSSVDGLYWDANVGLFVHMSELTIVHENLFGETAEEEESTDQEATEISHGSPHSTIGNLVWDTNAMSFVHPSELSGRVVVDDNGAVDVIEPPDPTDPVLNIDPNGWEWYGNPPEQAENTEEEGEEDDITF